MIVLGLLLLIATGALAMGVVLENTQSTTVEAFGYSLSDLSLGTVFAGGVLTGLLFMLGVSMLLAGLNRSRERRLTARDVNRTASENERLQEENERLRAQLEEERELVDPYVADPYGTDTVVRSSSYSEGYDPSYDGRYDGDDEHVSGERVVESETVTGTARPRTRSRRAKH